MRIFISYRRADSAAEAGRLYDRLAEQFGRRNVFMDVDDIGPGEDYLDAIERRVSACDTLIVLLGPGWVEAADNTGRRRLDDPGDLARLEVEAALKRNVRVIPILIDGVKMPGPEHLPESLQGLLRRQAVTLSHAGFHKDVDSLIERLGGKLKRGQGGKRGLLIPGAVGAAVALLLGAGYWASRPDPPVASAPADSASRTVDTPGSETPAETSNLASRTSDPSGGPPPAPPRRDPPPDGGARAGQPAASLTGTWYDSSDVPTYLEQTGNTVVGTTSNPFTGLAMGEISGTITGNTLTYRFVAYAGTGGAGQATIDPDGQHMSVIVTDSFGMTTQDRLHFEHTAQ